MSSWLQSHGYDKIEDGEGGSKTTKPSWLKRGWQSGKIHVIYVTLLVLVAVVSSYVSRSFSKQYYFDEPVRSELRCKDSLISLKAHTSTNRFLTAMSTVKLEPRTFVLNETFAKPPYKEGEEAWASLLPRQGGFFTNPRIAPKTSCLAVFHQIHCLTMLRGAFYEARPDLVVPGDNSSRPQHAHTHGFDPNKSVDVYHVGHCWELLRQTLTCRPDLTVEVADRKTQAVTGFGTEHQCVNWDELMGWMARNEWTEYLPSSEPEESSTA
ncbi:hypothetical protein CCHL11_06748 [Colletotrichum chlorophyti]|uniref:Oxidase ustYa n=1 Tax=Colletotrichum chlorophyti TaxID=708187 RepID=A0A1Q8RZ48_9PEZI|nr:hypothetical protein CCHL11_06748 [Colletotrichum chlorophyti]